MLDPERPALVLAPMEGLTDAPMRQVQGEIGAFTFAVSEFLRISATVPGVRAFQRHVPELIGGARTRSGLPVSVQLLGGDPERLACAAATACLAGARAIDLNFGCPAPTVNRHDGGATLLKYPTRIREIVAAVRGAVPREIPVSAKLRLGWDCPDAIHENASMAAEGGASWLTIHGRTRAQGYRPPVLWRPMGEVRARLGLPIVANGDLWTLDDFRRCQDETGCRHFMLGRGALADPLLSHRIARALGLPASAEPTPPLGWADPLRRLVDCMETYQGEAPRYQISRVKQWLKLASLYGGFEGFEAVKHAQTLDDIFALL
jgi:tRNA-dihydrouridine synthase C